MGTDIPLCAYDGCRGCGNCSTKTDYETKYNTLREKVLELLAVARTRALWPHELIKIKKELGL